jgi:hypothetical protein
VRILNKHGRTALHIACVNGKAKVAEALLEHVQNNPTVLFYLFTIQDTQGMTVFDHCANYAVSNPKLTEFLTKYAGKLKSTGHKLDERVEELTVGLYVERLGGRLNRALNEP